MSPNFINGLLFIICFFIERLEEKGIKENKRLLSLTVLNISELNHLKNAILEQSSLNKPNPERKYLFLQLFDEQRHDIYCMLSNYELFICQLSTSDADQNAWIQHYESIKTFKYELNSMMEIKIQN